LVGIKIFLKSVSTDIVRGYKLLIDKNEGMCRVFLENPEIRLAPFWI
jgi:hypothetical protein